VTAVIPFYKVETFDGQLKQVMAESFIAAWSALCDSRHPTVEGDYAEHTIHLMFRRMTALARQGVRDPRQLIEAAVGIAVASRLSPQRADAIELATPIPRCPRSDVA
jgi:hypothetical protein